MALEEYLFPIYRVPQKGTGVAILELEKGAVIREIGLMMFLMMLVLIDINLKKTLNFQLSLSDANHKE
jgi:hypothetical protein